MALIKKDLVRGPTHRSRRSEGLRPRTTDGRVDEVGDRPLVGRTRQRIPSQSDLPHRGGRLLRVTPDPAVVRGVAPPTGGYDASDRKRSFPPITPIAPIPLIPPITPIALIAPITLIALIAPIAPITPTAPITPITPIAPIAPITLIAPIAPITPTSPNSNF